MAIRFYCPLGHRLSAPKNQEGKLVHCPVCGQRVIVPRINLGIVTFGVVDPIKKPFSSISSAPSDSFSTSASPAAESGSPALSVSPSPQGTGEGVVRSDEQAALALVFQLESSPPEPASSCPGQFDPRSEAFAQPAQGDGNATVSSQPNQIPSLEGSPRIDPSSIEESVSEEASASQNTPEPSQAGGSFPTVPSASPAAFLLDRADTQDADSSPPSFAPSDDLFPWIEIVPVEESPEKLLPPENVLWEGVLENLEQGAAGASLEDSSSKVATTSSSEDASGIEPSADFHTESPKTQEVMGDHVLMGAPEATPPASRVQEADLSHPTLAPQESAQQARWRPGFKEEVLSGQAAGGKTGLDAQPTLLKRPLEAQRPAPERKIAQPMEFDPARRSGARWLAFWLSLIILFSMGPALRYLVLSTAPGWARGLVLGGLWQLAYVAWMVLVPHEAALWIVMGVFAAGATLSALLTALTLATPLDQPLPAGLGDIRQWAPSWFACVLAVQTLGAYLTGRLALLWQQAELRRNRHRVVGPSST